MLETKINANITTTVHNGGSDINGAPYVDVDVPATGFFIWYVTLAFQSNTTGARHVLMDVFRQGSIKYGLGSEAKVGASQSGKTILTLTSMAYMLASDTIRIRLWQNSGISLTVTGFCIGYQLS